MIKVALTLSYALVFSERSYVLAEFDKKGQDYILGDFSHNDLSRVAKLLEHSLPMTQTRSGPEFHF
jgi:hypothetical protein